MSHESNDHYFTSIFIFHITYMEKITGLAISAVYNKYMLWRFYVQTYRVQELSRDQRRPSGPPPPPPPLHAHGCSIGSVHWQERTSCSRLVFRPDESARRARRSAD